MIRTGLALLFVLASCSPLIDPTSEDVPNPLPPGMAAEVTYNPRDNSFTLANVSGGYVWYLGGERVVCERDTPEGWGQVNVVWCGTGVGNTLLPLGPRQTVTFRFWQDPTRKGWCAAANRFVERGGDLKTLKARMGVVVCSDKNGPVSVLYSEGVFLPR